MTRKPCIGLRFEVIWTDPDLKEIRVEATNGYFSAAVNVYVPPDFALHVSETLRGFPKCNADQVSFDFGNQDSNSVAFAFSCIDAAGHCVLCVDVRNVDSSSSNSSQLLDQCRLRIPCVASAIDDFLVQLLSSSGTVGGHAELKADLDRLNAIVW